MTIKDPISTQAAAEITGFTDRHVRHLVQIGQLRGERVGRDVWVSRAAAHTYKRKKAPKTSS
jgi:excisionase family DNA binding protein